MAQFFCGCYLSALVLKNLEYQWLTNVLWYFTSLYGSHLWQDQNDINCHKAKQCNHTNDHKSRLQQKKVIKGKKIGENNIWVQIPKSGVSSTKLGGRWMWAASTLSVLLILIILCVDALTDWYVDGLSLLISPLWCTKSFLQLHAWAFFLLSSCFSFFLYPKQFTIQMDNFSINLYIYLFLKWKMCLLIRLPTSKRVRLRCAFLGTLFSWSGREAPKQEGVIGCQKVVRWGLDRSIAELGGCGGWSWKQCFAVWWPCSQSCLIVVRMGTREEPSDVRENKELFTPAESEPNGAAEAVCNEV